MALDRGVALYSGRWRGPRAEADLRQLVANHKWALVDRFGLDVVTVGYGSNTCGMPRTPFLQSSVQLWDLPRERLRAVYRTDPPGRHPINRSNKQVHISPWKYSQLLGWRIQYAHVAEAFRAARAWRTHRFYVRTRIDASFGTPPVFDLAQVDRGVVYAMQKPNGWFFNRSLVIYHDWIYVANAASTLALSSTDRAVVDVEARCFGTCSEEQVTLQLRQRGVTLVSMPTAVNITIVRFAQRTCYPYPLANASLSATT